MAGKYNNRNRDSSDFKFKNNDPFPKKKMKSTLESDYVKSQNIKKKTAKKVIKTGLKKVPYVGTALTALSIGKNLVRIAKARKTMVPMKGSKNYKAPNKKSTGGFAGGEKSTRAALNLKNKRVSKMMAEVNKKGTNPFPMRVDTRHGGASDAGRSTEGVTKHLLRSVKDSKALFKETYKKSYDLSSKIKNQILRKKRTAADYVKKGKPYKDRKPK